MEVAPDVEAYVAHLATKDHVPSVIKANYAESLWCDVLESNRRRDGYLSIAWFDLVKKHAYFDIEKFKSIDVPLDVVHRVLQQLTQTIIPVSYVITEPEEGLDRIARAAPPKHTHEDLFAPVSMLDAMTPATTQFCDDALGVIESADFDAEPLLRHRLWAEAVFGEAYSNARQKLGILERGYPSSHTAVKGFADLDKPDDEYDEIKYALNQKNKQGNKETARQRMTQIMHIHKIADTEIVRARKDYERNAVWRRDGCLSESMLHCKTLGDHLDKHIQRLRDAALIDMKTEIRQVAKEAADADIVPEKEDDLSLDVLRFFAEADKLGADEIKTNLEQSYDIILSEAEKTTIQTQIIGPKSGDRRSPPDDNPKRKIQKGGPPTAADANRKAMDESLESAVPSDAAAASATTPASPPDAAVAAADMADIDEAVRSAAAAPSAPVGVPAVASRGQVRTKRPVEIQPPPGKRQKGSAPIAYLGKNDVLKFIHTPFETDDSTKLLEKLKSKFPPESMTDFKKYAGGQPDNIALQCGLIQSVTSGIVNDLLIVNDPRTDSSSSVGAATGSATTTNTVIESADFATFSAEVKMTIALYNAVVKFKLDRSNPEIETFMAQFFALYDNMTWTDTTALNVYVCRAVITVAAILFSLSLDKKWNQHMAQKLAGFTSHTDVKTLSNIIREFKKRLTSI